MGGSLPHCMFYLCVYSLIILQLLSGITVSGIVAGWSMISNFVNIICGIEINVYDPIWLYAYIYNIHIHILLFVSFCKRGYCGTSRIVFISRNWATPLSGLVLAPNAFTLHCHGPNLLPNNINQSTNTPIPRTNPANKMFSGKTLFAAASPW
jgi:hypothetical protein